MGHELYKLGMPVRTAHVLLAHGIRTIEELQKLNRRELLSINNLGSKSLGEVAWSLYQYSKDSGNVPKAAIPAREDMALRDYFAAKAMQSLVVVWDAQEQDDGINDCAVEAYAYADAMLKARGQ